MTGNIPSKFPHLLPPDTPCWQRFLAAHQSEYLSFDYDVRVGFGRPVGDEFDDAMKKMAIDLSQRRIDAVGFKDDQIEIFEVTRLAGLKAIGQLITYPILYRMTYHPTLPLIPHLITEQIDTDLDVVYRTIQAIITIT